MTRTAGRRRGFGHLRQLPSGTASRATGTDEPRPSGAMPPAAPDARVGRHEELRDDKTAADVALAKQVHAVSRWRGAALTVL